MDTFLQDLRYGARTLIKNPGFAVLSILCLALGIGVNSTIFSVVDTVAIRPLPFRAPSELVALHATHKANGRRRRRRVDARRAGLEGAIARVRGHRGRRRAQPHAGRRRRRARAVRWRDGHLGPVSAAGHRPDPRPPDPCGGRRAGRAAGRPAVVRRLAAALCGGSGDHRPRHHGQRERPHGHRRDAGAVPVSRARAAVDSAGANRVPVDARRSQSVGLRAPAPGRVDRRRARAISPPSPARSRPSIPKTRGGARRPSRCARI